MTPARIRRWRGKMRILLDARLQAKKHIKRTAWAKFQNSVQPQSNLEDLLADDLTQSMMQADGVSPDLVRDLMSKVAGRGRAGPACPATHRLRTLRRRASNSLLACRLPSGPGGPYLQGGLLVVSAAGGLACFGAPVTGRPNGASAPLAGRNPIPPGPSPVGPLAARQDGDNGITIPTPPVQAKTRSTGRVLLVCRRLLRGRGGKAGTWS